MVKGRLDFLRQGRRHTLQVHFLGVLAAWFDEQLMAFLVGKADYLVLKAGAIPRAYAFYLSAVQRTAVDVVKDNLLCVLVRPRNMAYHLVFDRRLCIIRKRRGRLVALLYFEIVKIYRRPLYTRGGAGLEAAGGYTELSQARAEEGRGEYPVGAALKADLAHIYPAAQVSTRCYDYGLCAVHGEHTGGQQPFSVFVPCYIGDLSLS